MFQELIETREIRDTLFCFVSHRNMTVNSKKQIEPFLGMYFNESILHFQGAHVTSLTSNHKYQIPKDRAKQKQFMPIVDFLKFNYWLSRTKQCS